jgi:hypothetical protein
MGIVKISDLMHGNVRVASAALSRSINAQAEHWMRIGMLAELHPGLCYSDISRLLLRAGLSDLAGAPDMTDTADATPPQQAAFAAIEHVLDMQAQVRKPA